MKSNSRHNSPTAPARAFAFMPAAGFLRQPQALRLIPISKSTLLRRVQERTFPKPVRLSQRLTARRAGDLRRSIEEQGSAA